MNLPNVIADDERLTRYIFIPEWYDESTEEVLYPAFIPLRKNVVSVSRITGISEIEVWEIDKKFVSGCRPNNPAPAIARGDISALNIRSSKVEVIPKPTKNIRHAHIERFASTQSENKLIALELSQKAKLVMKNP